MAVIQIGCSQHGLPNWVQQIVTGIIIVMAVALDRWRQSRSDGGAVNETSTRGKVGACKPSADST